MSKECVEQVEGAGASVPMTDISNIDVPEGTDELSRNTRSRMARPPEQRFDAQDDHGRLGYAGGRFVLGLLGHQREFFVRYLPCRYAVAYERASDSRRPALYGCGCHARPRTPGQALDDAR